MSVYTRGGKRFFDVVAVSALAPLVFPVAAVVAAAIRVVDGSPVIFRHERLGRDGVPFAVLKFRTMAEERPGLSRDDRVTGLGRWLRKLSLDELPQLLNIMRGDMSLVGPRPLPARYGERYSAFQRRRLEVRPGLTGSAQISGRNDVPWERRFHLDVAYVDSVNLREDLTILLKTALLSIHVSRGGGATSPSAEFFGSKEGTQRG